MSEKADTLLGAWVDRCMNSGSIKFVRYIAKGKERRKARTIATPERRQVLSLTHLARNLANRKSGHNADGSH